MPGVIWRFLIWFTAVIKHLGGKFDRLTKHWPCLLPFLLQSCSYTIQYNFQELCTGRGGFCAGQLKILTQMVALWKLIATNTNMDRKNSIWRPDGLNLYITISCVVVMTIGSRWNTELGRSYPDEAGGSGGPGIAFGYLCWLFLQSDLFLGNLFWISLPTCHSQSYLFLVSLVNLTWFWVTDLGSVCRTVSGQSSLSVWPVSGQPSQSDLFLGNLFRVSLPTCLSQSYRLSHASNNNNH